MGNHAHVSMNSNIIVMQFLSIFVALVKRMKIKRKKGKKGEKVIKGLEKCKTGYGR